MKRTLISLTLAGLLSLGSCKQEVGPTGLSLNPQLPSDYLEKTSIYHVDSFAPSFSGSSMCLVDRESDGIVDEILINKGHHIRGGPESLIRLPGTVYKVADTVNIPMFVGPHEVLSGQERSALSETIRMFYKN